MELSITARCVHLCMVMIPVLHDLHTHTHIFQIVCFRKFHKFHVYALVPRNRRFFLGYFPRSRGVSQHSTLNACCEVIPSGPVPTTTRAKITLADFKCPRYPWNAGVLRCQNLDCLLNLPADELISAFMAIPKGMVMPLVRAVANMGTIRVDSWIHSHPFIKRLQDSNTGSLQQSTSPNLLGFAALMRSGQDMFAHPSVPWGPAIDGVEITAHPLELLKQEKVQWMYSWCFSISGDLVVDLYY